jgi:homogentisate 1,2-dioxygenase
MLDRVAVGQIPRKHHIALRDGEGRLRYEECLTRDGFDGPYTILYHVRRPHLQRVAATQHGWPLPEAGPRRPLAKRHLHGDRVPGRGGPAVDGRVPLLANGDVVVSIVRPEAPDPVYFTNGDADDVYFIRAGGGVLRSPLGDLRFAALDYVIVPRGLVHRFVPDGSAQEWLSIECLGGVGLLRQWRNEAGQLRMDAPYSHRDFRRPDFVGPMDEGIRHLVVKRGGAFHGFVQDDSPLDVVGWDGAVYPFVFPILNFQPRAGLVHLPPTWHGTFAARGALICSFVPRAVDFHPEAIPCPYPHSSPSCDELLYYVRGNFTSRKGVGPGSISLHPAGIPHGPHPGSYEASIGTRETSELAVMLDTFQPLALTEAALAVEDAGYQESFIG